MGAIARFFEPFHPRRMVSLVRTRGPESARQEEIEREAAADVAAIQQDDKYFSPDAPADQDELLSPVTRHEACHYGNSAGPKTGLGQLTPDRRSVQPGDLRRL